MRLLPITSVNLNRCGDIGCAKNFIQWVQKSRPALGVHLIVQYDITSISRVQKLRTYAQSKDIELTLVPARHGFI